MNSSQVLKETIKTLFLNREGKPYELTDGQVDIFTAIRDDQRKRVAIKAVTQYGKSDITALAVVWMCLNTRKHIAIVAPKVEQARIIMDYIIGHIFDNDQIASQVEIEGSLDRFKRERSKTRIDFKSGSRVFVLTADARTVSREAKSLMGFGADVVIVDESSLISDSMYAKIIRMVGGRAEGKIIQLGNPWERNHFFKAFHQDNYYKVSIDYQQAMREGRITREYIDEVKDTIDERHWQIFYECEFPDSVSDALIPLSHIEAAQERQMTDGVVHFGGDVARFGDDKSVAVVRKGGNVRRIEKWGHEDTVTTAKYFKEIINQEKPENVNIDVIGVGSGVVDRLREDGYSVRGVNVAEKPSDTEKFANLRAEIFWGLKERFESGDITIPKDNELLLQLSELRYYHRTGKVAIESKEDMKKRGLKSPDIADALALAFYMPSDGQANVYFG